VTCQTTRECLNVVQMAQIYTWLESLLVSISIKFQSHTHFAGTTGCNPAKPLESCSSLAWSRAVGATQLPTFHQRSLLLPVLRMDIMGLENEGTWSFKIYRSHAAILLVWINLSIYLICLSRWFIHIGGSIQIGPIY
jgi:hypothetical protein